MLNSLLIKRQRFAQHSLLLIFTKPFSCHGACEDKVNYKKEQMAFLFTMHFADVWDVAYSVMKCCSSEATQNDARCEKKLMKAINNL